MEARCTDNTIPILIRNNVVPEDVRNVEVIAHDSPAPLARHSLVCPWRQWSPWNFWGFAGNTTPNVAFPLYELNDELTTLTSEHTPSTPRLRVYRPLAFDPHMLSHETDYVFCRVSEFQKSGKATSKWWTRRDSNPRPSR